VQNVNKQHFVQFCTISGHSCSEMCSNMIGHWDSFLGTWPESAQFVNIPSLLVINFLNRSMAAGLITFLLSCKWEVQHIEHLTYRSLVGSTLEIYSVLLNCDDCTSHKTTTEQRTTSVQVVFLRGRHQARRRAGSRMQCHYQTDRKAVQHNRRNAV